MTTTELLNKLCQESKNHDHPTTTRKLLHDAAERLGELDDLVSDLMELNDLSAGEG